MKVRDLPATEGSAPVAFDVTNTFLGHDGVRRVVRGIPGVRLIRETRNELFPENGEICAFEIEGVQFVVTEVFDQTNRFWIGPWPVREVPQLATVRAAFVKSTWLGRLLSPAV